MNEPVLATRRKPLTRKQRKESHDRNGSICCVCLMPIPRGEPFIDEHIIPLGLGGSNDESNRGVAHLPCAKVKTKRDVNLIAKADRQRIKHLGIKNPNRRKIQSRGFPKRDHTAFTTDKRNSEGH